MATRARVRLELGLQFPLLAGAPINIQQPVVFGADDDTVLPAAHNDDTAIGIAHQTVHVVGQRLNILLFGQAIIEMTVGTGGSTRGKLQWMVANGVTDAPPNGGGTNSVIIVGRAMQSGIPGDNIGVLISAFRSVSA